MFGKKNAVKMEQCVVTLLLFGFPSENIHLTSYINY